MTNRRNLDSYTEAFYDDDWGEDVSDPLNACIDCGAEGIGEVCGQCGMPLCVMHAETGAGFCSQHPDKHFRGF